MGQIYKKHQPEKFKIFFKYIGLLTSICSFIFLAYLLFPLISWKFYFEPVFAANTFQTPIPKTTVLSSANIQSLFASAVNSLNLDYSDARNWFPQYHPAIRQYPADPAVITTFNISIPRLGINYANVSTIDTDLSRHLVLYPGTAIPPTKGNAVIFGHSTIPGWFNPKDYTTIFATLHTLKTGDIIRVTVNTKEFEYKIKSILVTSAVDTSIFAQDSDGSYLTLLTCTPPGTTWKRLALKAKLEE